MEVVIIGAGPVGCYAGYLLAKKGHNVSIYEKKAVIGKPIQCAGILTTDFEKFGLSVDSFLLNTITNIKVLSSVGEEVILNQKDYIICREKFDNFLAELALTEGVKINLQHPFLRREDKSIVVNDLVNKEEKKITLDIIIAADGPLSPTAKAYGLYDEKKKFYYGIQAVVEGNFDSQTHQTFFGDDCPDLFAWIVPESPTKARVGLASQKNSHHHFNKFMNQFNLNILEMQAGTIPLYEPKQELFKENCYLLGDAAGFVKATTLGGIIPGMEQAEILVDCLCNDKDYQQKIKPLKRKLSLHLMIRKVLDKFSDKDWRKLIQLMRQEKIKKVLKKHSRENPFPILSKIILKEPKFLYFLKYLF